METVTVWRVWLTAPVEQGIGALSPDERAHARKLGPQEVAQRWIASRAALRAILGQRLGIAPAEVALTTGIAGKPELAAGELQFNLSHSENLMLVALGPIRVGVDVERRRVMKDYPQLARHFFSLLERQHLGGLPEENRHDAFFRCWCMKEAYIKGRGDGLSHDLESFSVELRPGQPPALLESQDGESWTLFDVDAAPGYSAALAVEGVCGGFQIADWATNAAPTTMASESLAN